MNEDGNRMKHGKALVLGLAVAVMTACASGGGAAPGEPDGSGNQPRDNAATRAASVHLVQAGLAEGDQAREEYQQALAEALTAIEQMPDNPKAYLLAGQAAVGVDEWVQADTMFDRAVELRPAYAEQIMVEREQGWVNAYNMGADAMNAGDLERALALFEGADRLYQGRAEARIAMGSLHVNMGNTEEAVDAYLGALEILSNDPPEGMGEDQLAAWEDTRQMAAFNAAELLAKTGDYTRAAEILRGYLAENEGRLSPEMELRAQTSLAGFLAQSGDAEAAEALYEEILQRPNLTSDQQFQIGIGFFNTGDFVRAAEAFSTAAEMNPYSRDAHLNLVQAFYSRALELEEMEETAERNEELMGLYDQILETAEHVRELDPLNRNLLSFMLRAYRSKADMVGGQEAQRLTQATQELYRVFQNQSYEVTDIQLNLVGGSAQLTGMLTNLSGTAGETIQLQFEILDAQGGVVDTTTVPVTVPAQEASTQFSASLDIPGGNFAGWRYQLVE
jgi:tetratricopeptide (TPR) repeat protein